MDCSNTASFFKEVQRMCGSFNSCKDCPLYINHLYGCASARSIESYHVDAVQRWSDENPEPPKKTYADYFFECFPNAESYEVGNERLPCVCIASIYGVNRCLQSDSNVCRSCWNKPLPDDFHKRNTNRDE